MRRASPLLTLAILTLLCGLTSHAAKKSENAIASFAKFVEIPGAKPVGSETCATCHVDIAKDFRHAFHAQQGIECEQCHGAGSLHVEGGGDVAKIVAFGKRSPADANGACLSCHARDERIRNWMTGPHASNKVRCTDCHQTHNYAIKKNTATDVSFNLMTQGHVSSVENLVPETKPFIQPKWQANDVCLKCHQAQRGEMSLPYHHPLREGKMSCADCHDPHGGVRGDNLRAASANQLCLRCHSQYRGPFAYQHPPVTENCLICHSPHGSPNTNLLSVSMPALCLQCHAGHHDGAGTPLPDRCTNCHGSIHGTDTPTPSGGSRFVDKGPSDPTLVTSAHAKAMRAHSITSSGLQSVPSHVPTYPLGAGAGGLGVLSRYLTPMSGRNAMSEDQRSSETAPQNAYGAYSVTPGSYRFVDTSGYAGRVGEYDPLHQSAGADAETSYVSTPNHLVVVSRGNVLTSQDYQAASQVTAGQWVKFGFDIRSFVQQQENYPFYAFPVLDVPPGTTVAPDSTTNLIPSHTLLPVTRRLGKAYAQVKVPKLPVHLFIKGDWQARAGTSQFAYIDENTTPPVFAPNPTPPPPLLNTTCGAQCHFQSQSQLLNYTTRNIGGGADVDLGPVRMTYEHSYSSFNDRLVFPTATFTGPFTPADEGFSIFNPPRLGPAPPTVDAGNYAIDIPSPNTASTDRFSLNWTASPTLIFNGNVSYSRLRDTFTSYPQNAFNTDETVSWLPTNRLRVTGDYHQQNHINNFTPFYTLYGNMSYHDHWEGLKLDYDLPRDFNIEARYQHGGITRSNASLWPQVYSIDNTDLLTVVPSSSSNTAGLALRYHPRGLWSARAGYEWTGTHDPGYLVVPKSNNRTFADVSLTPTNWLVFSNDLSIIVQNAFAAIPLLRADGTGLPGDFQRRNRFYVDTASATVHVVPAWNLGLGYSYEQNNLTTYMAFQNDSGAGYVINEPAVPYKQLSQSVWGESGYTFKQRLLLNLRVTHNSAHSGMRPDVNPADAARLGNLSLLQSGTFDPDGLFPASLGNVQFAANQISQVIVPQWIGQSKLEYQFPRQFEGGLIFYYGSYRDYWNPGLNGTLRTFNLHVGRSW